MEAFEEGKKLRAHIDWRSDSDPCLIQITRFTNAKTSYEMRHNHLWQSPCSLHITLSRELKKQFLEKTARNWTLARQPIKVTHITSPPGTSFERLPHGGFFGISKAIGDDNQHPHGADHAANAIVVPTATAGSVGVDHRACSAEARRERAKPILPLHLKGMTTKGRLDLTEQNDDQSIPELNNENYMICLYIVRYIYIYIYTSA